MKHTIIHVWGVVALFAAALTLATAAAWPKPKAIRPVCAEVHLLKKWTAPLQPQGLYVDQFHGFVHEWHEFVIDIRKAIPTEPPDGLLCFFPTTETP